MAKLIKIKGFKVVLLLLVTMVFIQFNTVANADEKKPKSPIEVKVSYGIDGKYKPMGVLPINLEITNNGDEINGEIQVKVPNGMNNTYNLFAREVSIGKGETYKTVIPTEMNQEMKSIKVELTNGNVLVHEQKVVIDTGRVNDFDFFMGTLTDDFNGVSYFGEMMFTNQMTQGTECKTVNVPLSLNDIGISYKTISSLGVIVIDNYNMGDLKENHYDILSSWVNNGGTLIIGSGANSDKTIGAINKEFLDVTKGETAEKTISVFGSTVTTSVTDINLKNAKTLAEDNGVKLLQEVDRGEGSIIVASYDLGTEPMSSYFAGGKSWSKILQKNYDEIMDKSMNGKGQSDFYSMSALTQSVPLDKIPNMIVIVIVFIIYIAIIGGGLYFLLKKMDKKDYMWIVLPCIALIFSVLLFILGSRTRIKDVVLNQVSTITIDENGNGTPIGVVGIGNKYKSNLTIEEPEGIDMEYMSGMGMYGYNPAQEVKYDKLGVKTLYRDNGAYYDFNNNTALELSMFKVVGTEQKIDKFTTILNYDDGVIKGSVKNNLDSDANKLILIIGNNIWDLGSVNKNQQIDITGKKADSSMGINEYVMTNHPLYGMNMGMGTKKEYIKNEGRYLDALSNIAMQFQNKTGAYLVALTDKSVDYGINVNSKSVSRYDLTTIIQKIDIDYKDKDGNISLPSGYIAPQLLQKDSTVNIDSMAGYIYGNGEVEFEFVIPSNININKILLPGYDINYVGQGKQGMEFYNINTGEYEYIKANEKGTEINEVSNYVKDGRIKVKLQISDTTSSVIPQIGIKGREK